MNDSVTTPRLQDLASVGTRISWGAILAGTFVALGVYFLLATLGTAVGLSTSERVNPTTIQTGTVIWAFLTTIGALFLGGLVTSLFTAGENKIEAALAGIIMWALLFALLLVLGAVGVRAGFSALQGTANTSLASATPNWEIGARQAGVPAEQIDEWRRRQGSSDTTAQQTPSQQEVLNAAQRISWYAFLGTWLSMLAAAGGALLGAGPTFRIVAVQTPVIRTGSQAQAPGAPVYSR